MVKRTEKVSKFQAYEERQKAKGLKKVHPWIPEEDEERVLRYCARLRRQYEKRQSAQA